MGLSQRWLWCTKKNSFSCSQMPAMWEKVENRTTQSFFEKTSSMTLLKCSEIVMMSEAVRGGGHMRLDSDGLRETLLLRDKWCCCHLFNNPDSKHIWCWWIFFMFSQFLKTKLRIQRFCWEMPPKHTHTQSENLKYNQHGYYKWTLRHQDNTQNKH